MKAFFVRERGQIVVKLIYADSNEKLLLEEWLKVAGNRANVVVQGDSTVLLYPKQP